jgi:Rhodococcus equi virulence-associated protein
MEINEIIANDFSQQMQGKLEPHQIEAAVAKLRSNQTKYPTTGNLISAVIYYELNVHITGGKNFHGKAGGISTAGVGALFGDVYTDDLGSLYANTQGFQFTATSVYTSVLFTDGQGNLLGHFQAGAVSTVNGGGLGLGEWA